MIFHCMDEPLQDTGFPGCEATLEALKVEIGSQALQIVAVDAQQPAPVDPRMLAQQQEAIFVAWVVPGDGDAAYVLYAYDALNVQFVSKEVVLEPGKQPPDGQAVAFLYRNMLGTSLFADLESIETDVQLWSLAFPEEKVRKFKDVEGLNPPPAPLQPPRIHVDLAYHLTGYPAASRMWHMISPGLHGRVHPLVELWIDTGGTPGPVSVTDPATGLSMRLWLVHVLAGVRIRAVSRGVFTFLPGAGLGLDIPIMKVSGGATPGGDSLDAEVLATGAVSLLARFMFHRHVGLGVEFGAQVLFNTSRYCIGGPADPQENRCEAELLDFGRVSVFARLGVVFGL